MTRIPIVCIIPHVEWRPRVFQGGFCVEDSNTGFLCTRLLLPCPPCPLTSWKYGLFFLFVQFWDRCRHSWCMRTLFLLPLCCWPRLHGNQQINPRCIHTLFFSFKTHIFLITAICLRLLLQSFGKKAGQSKVCVFIPHLLCQDAIAHFLSTVHITGFRRDCAVQKNSRSETAFTWLLYYSRELLLLLLLRFNQFNGSYARGGHWKPQPRCLEMSPVHMSVLSTLYASNSQKPSTFWNSEHSPRAGQWPRNGPVESLSCTNQRLFAGFSFCISQLQSLVHLLIHPLLGFGTGKNTVCYVFLLFGIRDEACNSRGTIFLIFFFVFNTLFRINKNTLSGFWFVVSGLEELLGVVMVMRMSIWRLLPTVDTVHNAGSNENDK